ncbi:MAG: hypothetical protein V4792_09935 [Pseudomonadota bacterium]
MRPNCTPEQREANRLRERQRYYAQRDEILAREREVYRARRIAAGKPVREQPRGPRVLAEPPALPAPKPKKPAMTPSLHVAKRGPAGTDQEPDMSRAKVTVYQPPPSRYAATGPVIGGFATMGVGRYLSPELLKG